MKDYTAILKGNKTPITTTIQATSLLHAHDIVFKLWGSVGQYQIFEKGSNN